MGTVDNDKVFVGSLPSQSLYEYCFDADQQCWKVSCKTCLNAYRDAALTTPVANSAHVLRIS